MADEPRILVVEDEEVFALYLASRLEKMGCRVVGRAKTGEEAISLAAEFKPDMALMDIQLDGGMDGIEAARVLRREYGVPVVFMTAHSDDPMVERAKEVDPFGYLVKPVELRELKATIGTALHRARLEERLKSREANLRYIVHHSPYAVAVLDRDLRCLMVSNRYRLDFRLESAPIEGLPVFDAVPYLPEHFRRALDKALAGEATEVEEDRWQRPGGGDEYLRWECRPWWNRANDVGGVISYSEIITERIVAREELRRSEDRYRELVENAPLGIISIDESGRVMEINPKQAEIMGAPSVEEAREVNVFNFPPMVKAGIAARFRDCLRTGDTQAFEARYSTQWGWEVWQRYSIRPIRGPSGRVTGAQAVTEEITAAKRMEAQLRQSHKMEAVGTLAGGIAHDFNNILAAILGYTELARIEAGDENPAQHSLTQVFNGALRAKELVRQILTFSRQADQERRPVDTIPIIKEGLKFLRASLPKSIELVQSIEGDGSAINADPTQIHQVLMNLCTNAAAAIGDRAGRIEVSVQTVVLDELSAASIPGIGPGPYQRLSVADTGGGMEPDVIERIFEPFFTTKGPGEGTGLGLAVVHGIVASLGGTITLESLFGRGSTFQVFLPIIDRPADSPAPALEKAPTGTERILFVDDEAPLVHLVEQTLKRLGYRVSVRTDPVMALSDFRADPDAYDLVITDLTMPRMTGEVLAGEIMTVRPNLPIILCTGFSEIILEEKARELGIDGYIMKPFKAVDFARTVRRVLDDRLTFRTARSV